MEIKLKELREKAKLTQKELADKSNVSQNLIARIESGELTSTSTKTLFKLADALNTKVENFFTKNV